MQLTGTRNPDALLWRRCRGNQAQGSIAAVDASCGYTVRKRINWSKVSVLDYGMSLQLLILC